MLRFVICLAVVVCLTEAKQGGLNPTLMELGRGGGVTPEDLAGKISEFLSDFDELEEAKKTKEEALAKKPGLLRPKSAMTVKEFEKLTEPRVFVRWDAKKRPPLKHSQSSEAILSSLPPKSKTTKKDTFVETGARIELDESEVKQGHRLCVLDDIVDKNEAVAEVEKLIGKKKKENASPILIFHGFSAAKLIQRAPPGAQGDKQCPQKKLWVGVMQEESVRRLSTLDDSADASCRVYIPHANPWCSVYDIVKVVNKKPVLSMPSVSGLAAMTRLAFGSIVAGFVEVGGWWKAEPEDSQYFSKFMYILRKFGLNDGEDVFGVPFDFRQKPTVVPYHVETLEACDAAEYVSPDLSTCHFRRMAQLVISLAHARGQKVALVGHSHGNSVIQALMRYAPFVLHDDELVEFRAAIGAYFAIGAPNLGSADAMDSLVRGLSPSSFVANAEQVKQVMRGWPGLYWLFPKSLEETITLVDSQADATTRYSVPKFFINVIRVQKERLEQLSKKQCKNRGCTVFGGPAPVTPPFDDWEHVVEVMNNWHKFSGELNDLFFPYVRKQNRELYTFEVMCVASEKFQSKEDVKWTTAGVHPPHYSLTPSTVVKGDGTVTLKSQTYLCDCLKNSKDCYIPDAEPKVRGDGVTIALVDANHVDMALSPVVLSKILQFAMPVADVEKDQDLVKVDN